MAAFTSTTHPMRIDRVQTPLAGSLGLTFCTGKQDAHAQHGAWARDLAMRDSLAFPVSLLALGTRFNPVKLRVTG